MNLHVGERFAENLSRLALGIEPIDAARAARVAHTVELAFEQVPQPAWLWRRLGGGQDVNDVLPRMQRHTSCRYALRYRPGLQAQIDVRLIDRSRRFVPRRLRIPILTEQQVIANEGAVLAGNAAPLAPEQRIRRPFLFPGAAYDVSPTATGLRGRVVRGGRPMRWARLEARLAGGELVGHAHGDDRGEFLLLIGLPVTHVGAVSDPMAIILTVYGPGTPPAPTRPDQPALDPYWDLPQEVLAAPGDQPDPASEGISPPQGYRQAQLPWSVNLKLGSLSSEAASSFQFT